MSAAGTSAAGSPNDTGRGGAGLGGAGVATTGGATAGGATGSANGGKSAGGSLNAVGGSSGAAAGGTTSAGGTAGSGAAGAAGQPGGMLQPLTVYLAGDSTVQTYTNSSIHQAGWGQFLQATLDPKAKVDNQAIGGRTARRFIDEGRLKQISDKLKAGDYLLVQFGTNDGNKTATYELNGETIPYYLDPQTDFKTWLLEYVKVARARSASAVFVTPPPRMSCTGDSHNFGNGLGGYATAMKELGKAENVPVVDLNLRTLEYLNGIGCMAAGKDFFLIRADGTIDSTHFQEGGAQHMAEFVAAELKLLQLSLTSYVK